MGYVANQKALLITTVVVTVATMLVLGARFWARHKLQLKHGPDDWFILAAGIAFLSNNIFMWWALVHGYEGIEASEMTLEKLQTSLKLTFIGIFYEPLILTCCRLSVLFLYNWFFGIYSTLRIILFTYGAFTLTWAIAISFATIFRCEPIKGSWDLTIAPQCAFSIEALFVVAEAINAALDIFLVAPPVRRVSKMHLPLKERIALAIIFAVGGFVGLTSILRIVFTYNPSKRGAVVDSAFWLWIQYGTAIICACLPTLRPLLPSTKFFTPVSSKIKGLFTSLTKKPNISSPLPLKTPYL